MRILVRGTNWVGDAVMTVPALRHLRRVFPESHISLLTRSWAEAIFRDCGVADEIIAFDKTGSKVKDLRTQLALLRKGGFDAAILLPNSFESAFVAKLAGIKRRFGYSTDGRGILLSDPSTVPAWKEERHEVHYYLNLIDEVAEKLLEKRPAEAEETEPRIDVSDERRARARDILELEGVDPTRRTVVLGVGSANSLAKRWPAKYYARLGDLIQKELSANVVLLGTPDEKPVADEVRSLSELEPLSLAGGTNLSEAVGILAECDLLVSNDMGLAHIAPATGTMTITIFGPTKDKTTRPLSSRAEIIRNPVDCSPCMLRECPIDHRCMAGLLPEQVFEKVVAALG